MLLRALTLTFWWVLVCANSIHGQIGRIDNSRNEKRNQLLPEINRLRSKGIEGHGTYSPRIRIDTLATATDDDIKPLWPPEEYIEFNCYSPLISDRGLAVLEQLDSLKYVSLDYATDTSILYLRSKKKLESLTLQGQFQGRSLFVLQNLPSLERLKLCSSEIHDGAWREIGCCSNLKILQVEGCNITDDEIRHFRAMDNLKGINLSCNPITGATIDSLKELEFEGLGLNCCNIGLKGIDGLRNLRVKSVGAFNNPICDDALRQLKGSRFSQTVQNLQIARTHVTDESFETLSTFGSLTGVDLSYTKITGTGLKKLAVLPSFTGVSLDQTLITDESIREVTALANLTALSVIDTALTDESLKTLAELRKLKRLQIRGTKITESSYLWLKEQLPDCRIEWDPRPRNNMFFHGEFTTPQSWFLPTNRTRPGSDSDRGGSISPEFIRHLLRIVSHSTKVSGNDRKPLSGFPAAAELSTAGLPAIRAILDLDFRNETPQRIELLAWVLYLADDPEVTRFRLERAMRDPKRKDALARLKTEFDQLDPNDRQTWPEHRESKQQGSQTNP